MFFQGSWASEEDIERYGKHHVVIASLQNFLINIAFISSEFFLM